MKKHILVIDDDEGIRKSFTLAFEDTEYNVHTAESGETGILKAQGSKYDLIFIDLKMPGINGVETLREIRKIDKNVHIYIITAFHKEFLDLLKSATEDGIDFELLRKPIGSEQLRMIVKGIFEGSTKY